VLFENIHVHLTVFIIFLVLLSELVVPQEIFKQCLTEMQNFSMSVTLSDPIVKIKHNNSTTCRGSWQDIKNIKI